jgi:hypothetical protein
VAVGQPAAGKQPGGPGHRPNPPPDAGVNALKRLIQGRLRERGWSYGVVARRGGLPRSTVYNLATTDNLARPPLLGTLEKLACGFELPASALRAAAAEASGLHRDRSGPTSEKDAILIATLEALTPEDRQVVANLIESLRRRTIAAGDHARPDNTDPGPS